jgi:hypothetical protein
LVLPVALSQSLKKSVEFPGGDFRVFFKEEVSAVIDFHDADIGSLRRKRGLQPLIVNRPKAKHGHLELRVLQRPLLIGQALFFAAFTFAHRARCAAAIFLRAAADSVRFFGIVMTLGLALFAFTFAHRAFWAAAILALPADDIVPRVLLCFPYVAPKADNAAAIALTSLVKRSCSFFKILTAPFRLVIKSPSRGIVTG